MFSCCADNGPQRDAELFTFRNLLLSRALSKSLTSIHISFAALIWPTIQQLIMLCVTHNCKGSLSVGIAGIPPGFLCNAPLN